MLCSSDNKSMKQPCELEEFSKHFMMLSDTGNEMARG